MTTQTALNPAVHSQTKQSKIERYGWKLVDSPGDAMLIHKDKINIDDEYQRTATAMKVRGIASKWSWIACGCLIVGHRAGLYYVIDGGHRLLAARSRTDIGKLPCIVFQTEDIKQEAEGYLNANTQRRPMSAVEKFKALVITGDAAACKIAELLASANFEITSVTSAHSIRKVKCVRTLLTCYESNPEVLLKIWPLVIEIADDRVISELVVCSLFYLESAAFKEDRTITVAPWRKRILALGTDGIGDACKKAAAYYSSGGSRVWAKGLMDRLNHGVQNRLDLIKSDVLRNGDDP